jgi:hypothetical protein
MVTAPHADVEVTLQVQVRVIAQPGPGSARLAEFGMWRVAQQALFGEGDLSGRDGYADLPPNALTVYLLAIEEA